VELGGEWTVASEDEGSFTVLVLDEPGSVALLDCPEVLGGGGGAPPSLEPLPLGPAAFDTPFGRKLKDTSIY